MKLRVETGRVTVATNNKLPFLEEDLDEKVQSIGYKIPKPGGSVLVVSRDGSQTVGVVWSKEEMTITYDPSRGFLSIDGRSLKELAEGFAQLVNITQELLGGESERNIKWGELNLAARCATEKLPLDVIGRSATEIHTSLANLFGEKLLPFSVTAYSSEAEELEKPLNEIPDWFDLRVDPLIANPKYYFIRIIYRKKNPAQVGEFVQKLEIRLDDMIKMLEEG